MQLFKYKGYDAYGKKVDGEMTAHTIEEVERRVTAQSVTIIAIIPAGVARGGSGASSPSERSSDSLKGGGKRFSDADVAHVLRDLAVMAETGVPFVEALDAVIETAKTLAIQNALKRFKAEIVGGKGLSAGMRAANGFFPSIVCDMVKIAEEGGRLDKALASASAYVERAADLKRKVMNAMLYPVVLSVIACGTVLILLTFVMPRFADIFKKMGAQVPESTKMMLEMGNFLRTHPIQIVVGAIVGFYGLRALLRMPNVNTACAKFLLRVPVLGELLRRLSLARAFQSIATLLASNVAMLSALEHGAKVAGNAVIRDALMKARSAVEHGAPLSESLKETRAFPVMLIQMVSVGERTGRLSMLMANTASHMEEEVDGRLKAMISIVEPLMIVVMGCIVGGITMSIIIPMYSVVQNVH
jgi:type IV pilus assembly protein PilC